MSCGDHSTCFLFLVCYLRGAIYAALPEMQCQFLIMGPGNSVELLYD